MKNFFLWRCEPTRVMASSFLRFLDHTRRRTTVSRTPLDEWSARRTNLFLTTHNTHNRQTSILLVGFKPTISAGERPQTYALDRAATGTGYLWTYTRQSTKSTSLLFSVPGGTREGFFCDSWLRKVQKHRLISFSSASSISWGVLNHSVFLCTQQLVTNQCGPRQSKITNCEIIKCINQSEHNCISTNGTCSIYSINYMFRPLHWPSSG